MTEMILSSPFPAKLYQYQESFDEKMVTLSQKADISQF